MSSAMRLVPALSLSLALCLPITANSKGGHSGSGHATGSHVTHIHSSNIMIRHLFGNERQFRAHRWDKYYIVD